MSNINELPKDLPALEKEIELECEGNLTKTHYSARFKYRIPNLKARSLADRKRAELNGNIDERFLEPSVAQFHYMIAYLRATLIDVPEWWKKADYGFDLHDSNVVEELYAKAINFENEWMIQVWGEPKKPEKSHDQPKENE